jgi:hypothetical protein
MSHTVLRTVVRDGFPLRNTSGDSAARRRVTRQPQLDILESRVTPSGNYTNLAVSGAVMVTSPRDVKIEFGATPGSSFTVNGGAHNVTIIGGIPAGDTVTLNGPVRDVTICGDVSGAFAMTGSGHDVRMGNDFGSVTIGSSSAASIHDFKAGVIESGATFTVNASFHDGTVAAEDTGSVVSINPSHHSLKIHTHPPAKPSGNYTNLAVSGAVAVASPHDVKIEFGTTPGSSFTVDAGAHDVTIIGGIPAGDTVTLNGQVHDVTISGNVSGTLAMTGSGHDVRMGNVFGSVMIGSSSADSIHDFKAGVIETGATFTVNASFHDGTVGAEDTGSVVSINPSHHSLKILAHPPGKPGNYTNLAVSGAVVVTSPRDVKIEFGATPGSSFTVNGGAHDVTIIGGIPAGDTVTLNGSVHDVTISGSVSGTLAMTGSGCDVKIGDVFGSVTIGSSSAASIHDFRAGVIEMGATFTVNASFHDGMVAAEDMGSVVVLNPLHHRFKVG